jgi:hypothetical protein
MPTVLFAEGGGKWGFLVPHIMETWAEKDRDILEEMRHVRNELTERKPLVLLVSVSKQPSDADQGLRWLPHRAKESTLAPTGPPSGPPDAATHLTGP